jgi:hypothetical protein
VTAVLLTGKVLVAGGEFLATALSRRNAAAAIYVDSLDDITISIITAHELIVGGARNQRDAHGIDSLIETYPSACGSGCPHHRPRVPIAQAPRKTSWPANLRRLDRRDRHREGLRACLEDRKHFRMIGEVSLEVPSY